MILGNKKTIFFVLIIITIIGCTQNIKSHSQRTALNKIPEGPRQLNIVEQIDTCSAIKYKWGHKLQNEAIKYVDSTFNRICKWQDSVKLHSYSFTQLIKYTRTSDIKIQIHFKMETYNHLELLSKFNDYFSNGCTGKNITNYKYYEPEIKSFINYHITADSVSVLSKFNKFNSKFSRYIEGELWFYTTLQRFTTQPIDSLKMLNITVIDANNDGRNDILVDDIRGENHANSLTDFWIYSKSLNDFLLIEKLSAPIWGIDKERKIFYSGWHMSADESNSYSFKIVGTKAVKQK